MENTATHQVPLYHTQVISRHFVETRYLKFLIGFIAGAVLVFLPGLAEIKMLYEQLQSNRIFNNRRTSRFVSFIPINGKVKVYSNTAGIFNITSGKDMWKTFKKIHLLCFSLTYYLIKTSL